MTTATLNIEQFYSLSTDFSNAIDRFNTREQAGEDAYANCEKLLAELLPYGWTCEYGLDGVPFNFKQL